VKNTVHTAQKRNLKMSDELFNRIMDTLGGFLFGIGFGMIVGVYWL
jgi:hypothetical protein|tara:strand:+ start:144 stop:281 length:138 start_codon:yes stop_codon:yes gene_type:complete